MVSINRRARVPRLSTKSRIKFTATEFDKWKKKWVCQILNQFLNWIITSNKRAENIDLGLQSDARKDLLVEDNMRLYRVTNPIRLFCCHCEDIIRLQAYG